MSGNRVRVGVGPLQIGGVGIGSFMNNSTALFTTIRTFLNYEFLLYIQKKRDIKDRVSYIALPQLLSTI
jgi:hypothetical protein